MAGSLCRDNGCRGHGDDAGLPSESSPSFATADSLSAPAIDASDGMGVTDLHVAAAAGDADAVIARLVGGAHVNQVRGDGASPLWVASQLGHLGCVASLLAAGADADQETVAGWTPLWIAARNGHADVVAALLRGGADADKAAADGSRPVDVVCAVSPCPRQARSADISAMLSVGRGPTAECGDAPLSAGARADWEHECGPLDISSQHPTPAISEPSLSLLRVQQAHHASHLRFEVAAGDMLALPAPTRL